jgi:hypothetical protein
LAIDQLNYNLTEIQVQCEQALQRTVNIFLWEKIKITTDITLWLP